MPEQLPLAGVEVVGDGRLGVNVASWPDELVETVLSPTIYSSNLVKFQLFSEDVNNKTLFLT